MKVKNNSPKGKWVFVKIKGYSYKKWISGYSSLDIPEVSRIDQLNLNAHEEALLKVREKTGKTPGVNPVEDFYFSIKATNSTSGGTTSLSASTIYVPYESNISFSVYAETNQYLSAYTVNGTTQSIPVMSAATGTTSYTLSNIEQDKNIFVSFGTVS